MKRAVTSSSWMALVTFGMSSTFVDAQTAIVSDGSLGPVVDLSAVDVTIPAEIGRIEGNNLFHSFARFDIGTGERATFAGPSVLNNVISRITGGGHSLIDGTLASSVGAADVWLINPAGIVFGDQARLDVPAGFHATTATGIEFADGTVFDTTGAEGGSLSVAAPTEFGFLGATNSPLLVLGSTLEVGPSQQLSVVAGEIAVDASRLEAPGGRILVATQTEGGKVELQSNAAAGNLGGRLSIDNFSLITSSGIGGGAIRIVGGDVNVDNSSAVFGDNIAQDRPSGGLTVRANKLNVDSFSQLSADSLGAGEAGIVDIEVQSLELANGAIISSDAFNSGDAGSVQIDANGLTIDGGGFATGIRSRALAGSTGNAGSIVVASENIDLRNLGFISTSTLGVGAAGDIDVQAASGAVTLARGGKITSDTFTQGAAGDIVIAAGQIVVDGAGLNQWLVDGVALNDALTIISSDAEPFSGGDAGQISIRAGDILVQRSGRISSSTGATGTAGGIDITADNLRVIGDPNEPVLTEIASNAEPESTGGAAGTVLVNAGRIEIANSGRIASISFAAGDAGEVEVGANALAIERNGSIASVATSTGAAGLVTVKAKEMTLSEFGSISSSTFGAGAAGDVKIDNAGGTMSIASGAEISSSTSARGDAGNVTLMSGKLTVDGNSIQDVNSGIFSNANEGSTGSGGTISVIADDLTLLRRGRISSSTSGEGKAGDVRVEANGIVIDDETAGSFETGIFSEAEPRFVDGQVLSGGNAGSVTVVADDLLITGSGLVSSSNFSPGSAAGAVRIQAGNLVIDGGTDGGLQGSFSGVSSVNGPDNANDAGSIEVVADTISIRRQGMIISSSLSFVGGSAGRVDIEAGELTISGSNLEGDDTGVTTSALASQGSGNAGVIDIRADRLLVERRGRISSETVEGGNGVAGNLALSGDQIILRDAIVSTQGASNAGGRIDVRARQAIRARNTTITTSGALPTAGSSLLTLSAPLVEILDRSRMLSLSSDDPTTLVTDVRTGAAFVEGVLTIVSDDSEIAASTEVVVQGLDSEVGSELQIGGAITLNVDRLLAPACGLRSDDAASSFASTTSRNRVFETAPTDFLGARSNRLMSASGC